MKCISRWLPCCSHIFRSEEAAESRQREQTDAVARDESEAQILDLEEKIKALKDRAYAARYAGKLSELKQLAAAIVATEQKLKLAVLIMARFYIAYNY